MGELIRPESVSPQNLDMMLSMGYFRAADCFHRTTMLCDGQDILSPINIRIPLKNHEFPKSRRRQLKKAQQFTSQISDVDINEQVQRIYSLTKKRFMGYVATDLALMLYGDNSRDVFNTKMLSIFDGDKLIACSFFDLGVRSMASISGLHDPEYGKYGLGILTMLMEIEEAKKRELDFYYPGYVFNGSDKMDYKLSLGKCEYRSSGELWQPLLKDEKNNTWDISLANDTPWPNDLVKNITRFLAQAFELKGFNTFEFYYPLFDAPISSDDGFNNVKMPVLLALGSEIFAEFNFWKGKFRLFIAQHAIGPANKLMMDEAMFDGPKSYRQGFLGYGTILAESSSPFELLQIAERFVSKSHFISKVEEIATFNINDSLPELGSDSDEPADNKSDEKEMDGTDSEDNNKPRYA